MITHGLIERPLRYRDSPFVRSDGTVVHPYTRRHDERLVELRVHGKNPREIADIITQEFGIVRTGHSIDVRLKMLAAFDGGPEQ